MEVFLSIYFYTCFRSMDFLNPQLVLKLNPSGFLYIQGHLYTATQILQVRLAQSIIERT